MNHARLGMDDNRVNVLEGKLPTLHKAGRSTGRHPRHGRDSVLTEAVLWIYGAEIFERRMPRRTATLKHILGIFTTVPRAEQKW